LAPGTVGTLWAWLSFTVLAPWMAEWAWGGVLLLGLPLGVWACTRTARDLGVADPSAVVWDEIWAFWIVLWIITPAGWGFQLLAFLLFRWFDAAKPGPVGWADGLFKQRPGVDDPAQPPIGWRQGLGIMLDDAVAALCTLMVLAVGVAMWTAWRT
jgi:phosphatidylglycerophosphatase A